METAVCGAELQLGTCNVRSQFPQQYDSEAGLHYNHHRYYDPYLTVGYTQADPLGLEAGWNRFGYVEGNRFGFADPEGLWSWTFGGFVGPGFLITSGRNPNGSGFVLIQLGYGVGGGSSIDLNGVQPGYRDCQGNAWGAGVGLYGEGGIQIGPAGGNISTSIGTNFRPRNGADPYFNSPGFGTSMNSPSTEGKGIARKIFGLSGAASAGVQITIFGGGGGNKPCRC